MLTTLITSKTRIKLITRFFLNPQSKAYLRGLEKSFGESSNAVRVELNRFEQAGLLSSTMEGNRKVYTTNTHHPLYPEIHNMLFKEMGIDHLIEEIAMNFKKIDQVWLTGEIARGIDSKLIDLMVVGQGIDQEYLTPLQSKAFGLMRLPVRFTIFSLDTFASDKANFKPSENFLIWESRTPSLLH